MEWMLMPLRRYAEFNGRSRRKEYWMFTLFLILVSVVLLLLEMAAGVDEMFGAGGGPLSLIFTLATFVPSLSVSVRRLHDVDRTGWWLVVPLVALVLLGFAGVTQFGWLAAVAGIVALVSLIVILVFAVSDGTPGPNRFGPDPKNPIDAETFA